MGLKRFEIHGHSLLTERQIVLVISFASKNTSSQGYNNLTPSYKHTLHLKSKDTFE